jgi:hypothetical protein
MERAPSLKEIIQLAWDRFTIITAIIGDVQGRAIATAFYFTVLVPFGVASRLLSDPLALKSSGQPSWINRPPTPEALDAARRQG